MKDKNALNPVNNHENEKLTFDAESGELKWVSKDKSEDALEIPMKHFKSDGFF